MRRLLILAVSIVVLFMFAPSPGFIHTDPASDWIPADPPAQADTPLEDGQRAMLMQDSPAPHAFLMHAPNCFIMADGTQKCDDPISGSTVALSILGVNYQNAIAMIFGPRSNTVAIKMVQRNPAVALLLGMRSSVRS